MNTLPNETPELSSLIRDFWESEACGERYFIGEDVVRALELQAQVKAQLEPYIAQFARYADGAGKHVLEVGVGLGADHAQWAKHHPELLCGVDVTVRGCRYTQQRLQAAGLKSNITVADALSLPYPDHHFDLVYSFGVLHHTPDPAKAIKEVLRVLKPGGQCRIMLYRKHGLVFLLLWARYALLKGRPWRSLDDVIYHFNESIGTRAYSHREIVQLFAGFEQVTIRPCLTHGDLLDGDVGARHKGRALKVLKALWPRPLVRLVGDRVGSDWLIEAKKPG